jgi:hypothetical protein
MSALPEANPVATPEPAPAPAQDKPVQAATQEAPAEAPVKTFFSKKAAKAETAPELPDVSKLSPELQNVYKSFQGDYTRKTQELAEMRKSWEAERESQMAAFKAEREGFQKSQEAILEAIRGRNPEAVPAANDPVSQIQALRAEGRYDEADKLMLDVVKQAALQEVAPIKAAAETQKLTATFQTTAINTVANNPVVAEYKDEVVKIFDAPTPQMQKIRAIALASPDNVQTFVPMVMNAIATEIHARNMEAQAQALRAELDTLKAKSSATKARMVPSSLVNTSGRSRETTGGGGGLAAALSRASEKLTGA